jgi:tRNA/rRNA methyltransferase
MALFPCRVVLVRPRVAENVGATARIMRNFGFTELTLVCPEVEPTERQARRLSTHGESILDRARIVEGFGQAVAECVLVCATSARTGKLIRGQFDTPRRIAGRVVDSFAAGPVALVFGPERTGLTDEEISRCHYLIHIPAESSYPALNLAQAVAVCLYEIRCALLDKDFEPVIAEPIQILSKVSPNAGAEAASSLPEVASFSEQEAMFNHLRQALEAIHFLYGPKADSLMHGLRRLIGRARPTHSEVGILHGLARQILWYVNRSD